MSQSEHVESCLAADRKLVELDDQLIGCGNSRTIAEQTIFIACGYESPRPEPAQAAVDMIGRIDLHIRVIRDVLEEAQTALINYLHGF